MVVLKQNCIEYLNQILLALLHRTRILAISITLRLKDLRTCAGHLMECNCQSLLLQSWITVASKSIWMISCDRSLLSHCAYPSPALSWSCKMNSLPVTFSLFVFIFFICNVGSHMVSHGHPHCHFIRKSVPSLLTRNKQSYLLAQINMSIVVHQHTHTLINDLLKTPNLNCGDLIPLCSCEFWDSET